MDEKDIQLVKQIVRETVHEILDAEVYGRILDLLDAVEAGIVGFKQQMANEKGVSTMPTAVKEETFTCLKFELMKGSRIGEYEVAYKQQNAEAQWLHAYNILKQANATIANRYYGEGYGYAYWLYGEDKIYRQKLGQKHS
ncbi:MAG: hypothetical protein QHH24_02765 [Candidatus Bathyarchaeota archaeon]|nr:hypothetical protein [Candidatus Bathyarchaeota archaeon]